MNTPISRPRLLRFATGTILAFLLCGIASSQAAAQAESQIVTALALEDQDLEPVVTPEVANPSTGDEDYTSTTPTLSINSVIRSEGNSGTRTFTFTVNLSRYSNVPVMVDFATADGSAFVADNDYISTSGTLTIPAHRRSAEVRVTVKGDVKSEAHETFYVNLFNPVNAIITIAQGLGVIRNDDGTTDVLPGTVTEFALTRVAPNPAFGPAHIDYAVARETGVRLSVVDIQGRVMAVLVDRVLPAGRYQTVWNGATASGFAPAGAYFVLYEAEGKRMSQRIMLMR